MLFSFRKSFVFEFNLFISRICFSVYGLETSKHLCLKLARLMQSVKGCFSVIAWLWHSAHSGTGRPFIKYPWVSNVRPALSLLKTVSTFLRLLFYFHGRVSDLIFFNLSSFSKHYVFYFSCLASSIHGNRSYLRHSIIYSFRLDASFTGLPACPGVQVFSRVPLFFPSSFCRFAMVCFSFRTFGLVGNWFWSACRQLLESVNIEKFFPFVAGIVFRTRCVASVSAVYLELIFGSDAESVLFPVATTAPIPILLLKSSVCTPLTKIVRSLLKIISTTFYVARFFEKSFTTWKIGERTQWEGIRIEIQGKSFEILICSNTQGLYM